MVQGLRTDPRQVPRILIRHLTTVNYLNPSSMGSNTSGLQGHLHSCTQLHTYIYVIKNEKQVFKI